MLGRWAPWRFGLKNLSNFKDIFQNQMFHFPKHDRHAHKTQTQMF
jgi:hypothetical protein